MRGFGIGLAQRVLERERIGGAVALDDHALQADERRPVEQARIDPMLEGAQHGIGDERDEPREGVAGEFGLQHLVEHHGESFGRLQHHVADEAVADEDFGRALVDVVAFDIAVEIEARRAQQFPGALRELVALDLFLADVEEADRRPLDAVHRRHQRGSHDRELHELLGRAIDVGAQVQHRHDAVARRQLRGDGRAVDAGQRLQHEARDRHQRAGVARRHARLRPPRPSRG